MSCSCLKSKLGGSAAEQCERPMARSRLTLTVFVLLCFCVTSTSYLLTRPFGSRKSISSCFESLLQPLAKCLVQGGPSIAAGLVMTTGSPQPPRLVFLVSLSWSLTEGLCPPWPGPVQTLAMLPSGTLWASRVSCHSCDCSSAASGG